MEVSKRDLVLNYLKDHPEASNKEVSEKLTTPDNEISAAYVSQIKTNEKKKTAQAAVGTTFNLDGFKQLMIAKKQVTALGGNDKCVEALMVVKELMNTMGSFEAVESVLTSLNELKEIA